jgi:uncharacterized protein (DUF305 family)
MSSQIKTQYALLAGGGLILLGILGFLSWINNPGKITLWDADKTLVHTNTIRQSPDDLGRPDKQFIEMMVPALQASTALRQSYKADGDLAALIDNISKTEKAHLDQLKVIYRQNYTSWYSTEPPATMSELDEEKTPMEEEVSRKNGPHSQQELLHRMIHRAKMTRRLAFLAVDNAKDPELRTIARDMITQENQVVDSLYKALEKINSEVPGQGPLPSRTEPLGSPLQSSPLKAPKSSIKQP